jgi:hypothetical protein
MGETMSDHQEADSYPIQPRPVRFLDWVPEDKRQLVAALMVEIAREEAFIGADTQACGCGDFIDAALRLGARATKFANSSEVVEGFHGDVALPGDERTPQLPESPDLF